MKAVLDFFFAALPWLTCGLMVAVFAANAYRGKPKKSSGVEGKDDKKTSGNAVSMYVVAVICYVTALLMTFPTTQSSHSDTMVWMGLGSMFLCLGAANNLRKKE